MTDDVGQYFGRTAKEWAQIVADKADSEDRLWTAGERAARERDEARAERDRLVTAVRWIQLEAVEAMETHTAGDLQRIYDRCAAELTAIRDQEQDAR